MNTGICSKRTKIEVILISVVALLVPVLITLIILVAQPKASGLTFNNTPQAEACRSQICIKEALTILNRIDMTVDPCEDFYAFACNNAEALPPKNPTHGPFASILEVFNSQLEEMYIKPSDQTDHQLVRTQKQLYQACLNETAIDLDAFKTVQEVLILAGGWPVVEGHKWNEAKYDLIQSTYKLRQLGYFHSIFLDLTITTDPEKKDGYIFQISIPPVEDVYSKFFNTDETNGFMADVAVVFGAEVHRALGEMTQTLEFLLDLQWIQTNSEKTDDEYQRLTVDDIQKKHGVINWLNFINEIAAVSPSVTSEDYVLFPTEAAMDNWLSVLMKAPKRLHANYMMWRVVENNLPYITTKLRNEKIKPKFALEEDETRSEYCMQLLRESFSPSPIDIMYLRKYLPKSKSEQIEELLQYVKTQLKDVLQHLNWIKDDDKKNLVEKIGRVAIALGAPGNYFDDNIFDRMTFNVTTANFITMMAQAKMANFNQIYGLIKESPKQTRLSWWKISTDLSFDLLDQHEIELSPGILQDFVFNERRPNYLNYGIMGLTIKNVLYKLIEASYDWMSKSHCSIEGVHVPDYLLYHPLSHMLATKVSYAAYKNWVKENKEEELLYGLDYTPEQLFWISSGELYCHYSDAALNLNLINATTKDSYNSVVKGVVNRNPKVMEDFNCGIYIEEKCVLE